MEWSMQRFRSLAGLAIAGLAACSSREGGPREFEAAKTYEPVGRDVRWDASSSERFGMSSKDFAMPSGGAQKSASEYKLPAGWSELPTSQFREANFRVGGDPNAECYLSTLSGEGGGLEANVNRWRKQMSLDALSAADVAALPRVEWLGKQAVSVDFTGTWTGMGGSNNSEGWRLVGLLLVEPTQSRFLKMTGPSAVIEKEVAHFRELAASFRLGGSSDGAAEIDPSAGLPPGHPPMTQASGASDPMAGAMTSTVTGAAPEGNRSASGFEWAPPAGWKRGPEKSMREITYLVGEAGEAECYVTVLGGAGGGMQANINRWCGQMGQAPLSESDVAKLVKFPMLGGEACMVELERGGASSASAEYLLGAVCLLPDRSVFVKMTGPRALLEREHAGFVEFCKSARTAQ
jgi:hypothetical protein